MAAWQVEFSIVPRRALAAAGHVPPSQAIGTHWWSSMALPADYARRLASIASPATSSTADLQTWGQEDGNRLDVWSEHGRATRVTARVDVRRLDSRFGAMLLQFARTADAVLVRGDGMIIEPSVAAFAAALRSSAAWRFANDPATFLASHLDDEDEEE